jgi:8-hydroxy-5-deazaflavin:NADPH oxidoreductase
MTEREVPHVDGLVIGILGGTGDQGRGLALRFARVYAGRLRNCGQVEAFTANLVSINRRYKAHAGLRITDL